jgi:hypothetical protein
MQAGGFGRSHQSNVQPSKNWTWKMLNWIGSHPRENSTAVKLPQYFHLISAREPRIRWFMSLCCVALYEHDSPEKNSVNFCVRHWDKQPSLHRPLLGSIWKATVGAGLFKRTASVANNGMQLHCKTLAFSTTIYCEDDVKWEIISSFCTIHTMSCARILGRETCHTRYSWYSVYLVLVEYL